ncbi:hypothetical protein OO010_03500 [Flavobacteriaceae bacterium KMM 6898]|nr:hypothetical protein [Flavobacteriaceae bacterium KMM 6898]
MDYSTAYNYSYDTRAEQLTEHIKEALCKHKDSSRPFDKAFEKISNYLYDSKRLNSEHILYQNFPESFKIFRNRDQYYSDAPLKNILENECFESYNAEILNLNITLDYQSFFNLIAEDQSYEDIIEKSYNRKFFLKLIYESDNLKHFTIEAEKTEWENSKEYLALCKLISNDQKNLEQNNTVETEKRTENSIELSKEETSVAFHLSQFNDADKLFLYHIIYHSKANLSLTEYHKLMLIVSGIKDRSIFYGESKNNTHYSMSIKGINYYYGNSQRTFINEILEKVEFLKSKNITGEIKKIKLGIK